MHALERYQELYDETQLPTLTKEGQAPKVLPYRYVRPRTDVSGRQPKTEPIEKTERLTQQRKMNLDKVNAWFPKDLQKLVTCMHA